MLRQLLAAASCALLAQTAVAAEAGKIIYVVGNAQVAEKPAQLNAAVQEGDLLSTGGDGYLYIKTVDNGLFIVRPSSKARIAAYHIDEKNPANTRVKLELISGVARSKSGDAVKLARQNFRFNTPVAAIGVRGTDFTVFTDQDTSRVTVNSGAITISGFGGACSPEGAGPCEGQAARDLVAAQKGSLLQFRRGQAAPQLLPESSSIAPDVVAPPRADEPGKQAAASGANVLPAVPNLDAHKAASLQQLTIANNGNGNGSSGKPENPTVTVPPVVDTGTTKPPEVVNPPAVTPPVVTPVDPVVEVPPVVTPPVVTPPVVTPPVVEPTVPERQIVWGRWQPLLNKAADLDMTAELKKGSSMIASNADFALFRTTGKDYVVPERGNMSFTLERGEAYIHNDNTALPTVAASLEKGLLSFNFDKRTFATSFDLVNGDERLLMQSTGKVAADGRFVGDALYIQPNNMYVQGVLSSEKGTSAAYLFSRRLSDRTIYGATSWGNPVTK
nr:FecR family protein [uncultured Duganella sp.]